MKEIWIGVILGVEFTDGQSHNESLEQRADKVVQLLQE